jgi:hypothetical protein
VGGATDTSLMEAAAEALVIVVVVRPEGPTSTSLLVAEDVLEVVLVVVVAGCSSSTFSTVANLCREVTELTWHQNITLWFLSVLNVVVMSLYVFLLI